MPETSIRKSFFRLAAALSALGALTLHPVLTPNAAAQAKYYCPRCKKYYSTTRCPVTGQATVLVAAKPKPAPKKVAAQPPSSKPAAGARGGRGSAAATPSASSRSTGGSVTSATSDLKRALEDAKEKDANETEIARRVTAAINKGAAVDTVNSEGDTALIWASMAEKADLARLLLSKNAQVNIANKTGITALMYAAAGSPSITRMLIEKRASINSKTKSGLTPLMAAAAFGELECAQLLVTAGAQISSTTVNGETALSLAVTKGKADIVKYLIGKGANVNVTYTEEDKKTTAFVSLAADDKIDDRIDIAKAMIGAGVNINATDDSGHTALHYAARNDDEDLAQMILATRKSDINHQCGLGFSPLMEAADTGSTSVAKLLIKAGADLNVKDEDDQTALDIADDKGNEDIVTLIKEAGGKATPKPDDEGEVAKPNKPTAKPDPKEPRTDPPAARGNTEASGKVKDLLSDTETRFIARWPAIKTAMDAGGDVNTRGESGETALFQACITGNAEAVRYLLAHSADINLADNEGHVPLHAAAIRADVTLIKALMKVDGANVDVADSTGWTPLMYAIDERSKESVRALLEAGADAVRLNKEGYAPLHLACWIPGDKNNPDGAPEIVAALLDAGKANIETKTQKGNTPLVYAAAYGRIGVVRLLLERGANTNVKSESGLTPLVVSSQPADMARDDIKKAKDVSDPEKDRLLKQLDKNYTEIVRLLKAGGAKE